MRTVNDATFLPLMRERIQQRIQQIENGDDAGGDRITVDLTLILALVEEFDEYLNGEFDFEDALTVPEQALVLLTQAMEHARQEYLQLIAEAKEGDTKWN